MKPLSASGTSFQRMLLSNIPWMAPDQMAFMKNSKYNSNEPVPHLATFSNIGGNRKNIELFMFVMSVFVELIK